MKQHILDKISLHQNLPKNVSSANTELFKGVMINNCS